MKELYINPEEKQVHVTPELYEAFPEAEMAFLTTNSTFKNNPEAYLRQLEESVFTFESSTGANIDCSLLPGNSTRMLVMWAPFSDSAPKSSAEEMYQYISGEPISKQKAAPNSWNQTTKSGVVHNLLQAIGEDMPVLTIYSPLPSVPHNTYTRQERKHIKQGDFTPSARIVEEAVAYAQERLHGKTSETQIDSYDMHGASLGASTAIGTAYGLKDQVRTVTAQELIIAPKHLGSLAARFTIKSVYESEFIADKQISNTVIAEPAIRQAIDKGGNEFMMMGRMLQGMSKISRLKGLTGGDRNKTPRLIEDLVGNNVSVVVPLAENSGLTHDTVNYLPQAGEQVITVRATEGYATHLIDEHVALTALIAVAHIRNNPS